MPRQQQPPINWGRKAQGAMVGFAGGAIIGFAASVLHSRRFRATPQAISGALFMGTVLGIGGAIRTN
jgi:hypothetical protein